MNIWLLIVLMALVTFSIRYALYAKANNIALPTKLERALKFSAPCVLTAIWVPSVLMPTGELDVSLNNPYFIGGLIAVIIGLWKKNTLLTIVVSMACFFSYKWFIG